MNLDIGALSEAYDYLKNPEEIDVDFLLQGCSNHGKNETQALGNKLIEIAEFRKDAIAFLSPWRGCFLSASGSGESLQLKTDAVTDNLVSYYAPITSSSYAVLDSGYKYMYCLLYTSPSPRD